MYGQIVGIIIGVLAGIIIVFLICREIVCWYWKINKLVELMEEQNDLLSSLSTKITSSSSSDVGNSNSTNPPRKPDIVNFGDTWTCKKCGDKNPITSSTCKGCGEYK
jgi:hypothetical protein